MKSWASYLASLCLAFPISEMGILIGLLDVCNEQRIVPGME